MIRSEPRTGCVARFSRSGPEIKRRLDLIILGIAIFLFG